MSLHYIIKEPKNVLEKNPVLILLHGYGSNEEDLFSFAKELPEEYFIISVRAPYDMQYGSYAWYSIDFDADENKFSNIPQAIVSRDRIANFIDEIILKYPIDSKKVTLIGFSQGCILSYAVALSYPEKISRIVAMSGYFNEKITVEDFDKKNLSNLKIYASHGTMDQVVPVDWHRKAKPILEKLGVEMEYKEYPMAHGISPNNFFDMKKWLLDN